MYSYTQNILIFMNGYQVKGIEAFEKFSIAKSVGLFRKKYRLEFFFIALYSFISYCFYTIFL